MYSLKIKNMWFWSIFKLLSDSLVKPKKAACGVKPGKSRSVSKNNKSWKLIPKNFSNWKFMKNMECCFELQLTRKFNWALIRLGWNYFL